MLSALMSGLMFTSCSSDDGNTISGPLEGKWNFDNVSYTVSGITSPEEDYEGNQTGCPADYVEFVTGGVYHEGDYTNTACELSVDNGTWVRTNNTITINGVEDGTIVKLTETALKVKYTTTEEGFTVTANISFTKA